MDPLQHLDWPFFEPRHRAFAAALEVWAQQTVRDVHGHDVDAQCKQLVQQLGDGGWLQHVVAGTDHGGAGYIGNC